jgi:hypothetical protein
VSYSSSKTEAKSTTTQRLSLKSGSTLQKGFVPPTGGSLAMYNLSGLAYYRHSDQGSMLCVDTLQAMYFDGAAYTPFSEHFPHLR